MTNREIIVRLDDLIEIVDDKEVRLLAKIIRDYLKANNKGKLGFSNDSNS